MKKLMKKDLPRARRILSITLTVAMLMSLWAVSFIPHAAASADTAVQTVYNRPESNGNLLRMWYTTPADVVLTESSRSWMRQTLPIGNGYMGGLIFGGVARERFHFNEKTMWNGGPGVKLNNSNQPTAYSYFFGNRGRKNPSNGTVSYPIRSASWWETYRQGLDSKTTTVFGNSTQTTAAQRQAVLNQVAGEINGFEYFMDFGDLYFDFAGISNTGVTNYVRDLDMRTAISSVDYDFDGVHYSREYLASYPDNVMAIRLTASEPGKLTFNTSFEFSGSATLAANRTFSAAGNMMSMRGKFTSNSLICQANALILNEGGTVTANANGTLSVAGADAVTVLFASGTDYANVYPLYRGADPDGVINERLAAAAEKTYDQIKRDHLDDYCPLFSRVELDLDAECPEIPTDKLIQNYRAGVYDRAAEIMTYQFGRYFTIAGSREGALPTNLQGVWGIGSFSWYGDYHFNINLQMNYWPTMSTNLAECLVPLNDFIQTLRKPGRINVLTATGLFDDVLADIDDIEDLDEIDSIISQPIGWMIHCFTNAYGYSAQNQSNLAGWNPSGSAWIMQNIYDYYRFTGDTEYLRDYIYPTMKELADFWTKFLWWSPYQQRYVVAPSYSPENGPVAIGTTYDQSLIWQLFEETSQAAGILGVDADRVAVWKDYQSKLNPIMIGDDGQIKEWYEETSFGFAQAGSLPEAMIPDWRSLTGIGQIGTSVPHRHMSHLMGLYPGTLLNKDNDVYFDAASVSLHERGLEDTGWSKAHKINLWSRMGDGENAYAIVRSMIAGNNAGILENLFDSHGSGTNYQANPIFQIDGNYGITAGMTEMLLQSQLGYTQFLPALPQEWAKGSVKGLVARGNFVIDMDWEDGKADTFNVTSRNGGTFIAEYTDLSDFKVVDSKGSPVKINILSDDKISFNTVKGRTYTLSAQQKDAPGEGNLRLWYTSAASTATPTANGSVNWQSTVLPIGNGYMGGMIFGSIVREQIHYNEKSLWTGGPAVSPSTVNRPPATYNWGNRASQITTAELNEFRTLLDDKTNYVFGLNQSQGAATAGSAQNWLIRRVMYGGANVTTSPYVGMGTYQDFGDVYLDFAPSGLTANAVSNYVRDLDIETAVSSVNYDYDGVTYRREFFNSHPDNVLAMRLTASEPGKLTFNVTAPLYTSGKGGMSTEAVGDTITAKGYITDNGLRFESQIKVIPEGGAMTATTSGTNGATSNLAVVGADAVTILLVCGTDYKNEQPNYRTGVDPHVAVADRIAAAAGMGYNLLMKRHLVDYQPLFSRVKLNLGELPEDIPTDQIVANYRSNNNYSTALEALAYQYGRYLAISTSRAGCLPPNLVGVWQIGAAVWNGDYHFNENFQMNYWPMLASNLAECAEPLVDFMESLRVPGRAAAGASMGSPSGPGEANGFLIHTATNIFGLSGPYQSQEFGWNVGGVSWELQSVYDYYKFTGDKKYLRDKIYPMLKEQATFYTNILWWSDYQQRLVVGPSHSPEQGPTVNGTTYDQSVAWEAFKEAIDCAEILGVDADLREIWAEKQSQLNPIIIGQSGQVKEWFEETRITPNAAGLPIAYAQAGNLPEEAIYNYNAGHGGVAHRHISNLVGLYPGTLINKDDNPEFLNAAKVSLNFRGFEATGWSRAHKLNAWARTGDADSTYRMVQAWVGGGYNGLMTNLWDSHGEGGTTGGVKQFTRTEWQIDGNFGYTAGINEMLLQSQLGYTEFLPALPSAWADGSVSGLVARGNFEIDMDWSNGQANAFKVKSRAGGTFIGQYYFLSGGTVADSSGREVAFDIISNDKISFETIKGETYTIIPGDPECLYRFVSSIKDGKYVSALHNLKEEAMEGYFILAVYDSKGRLAFIESKDFNMPSREYGFTEFSISATEYPDSDYTIKAYFWDLNFVPLNEALTPAP